MKKIILIIISVVMLFTACEKSSPQQIDPSEEFGGITFGMTQDEIISFLGIESNIISETDYNDFDYSTAITTNSIWRMNAEFYNVSDAFITYNFDDYGKFYKITVDYFDSKQVFSDYAIIKETVLKNYPPKTYNPRIYDYGEDDLLDYNTENRSIFLRLLDGDISLYIKVNEQISSDNDET